MDLKLKISPEATPDLGSQSGIPDLGLDLGLLQVPPARGRKPASIASSFLRDLAPEDILDLSGEICWESETPSIQKLKHSHHNLARLMAQGLPGSELSLITGFSPSRISILKHDPAFAELVVYYAEQVEEVFVNVHERLATVGMDALQELQDRLETEGESFSTKELLDTIGVTLDRGGYGPKSIVQHNIGGGLYDILDIIKKEVDSRQNGNIKTLVPLSASPDTGPPMGGASNLEADPNPAPSREGD